MKVYTTENIRPFAEDLAIYLDKHKDDFADINTFGVHLCVVIDVDVDELKELIIKFMLE